MIAKTMLTGVMLYSLLVLATSFVEDFSRWRTRLLGSKGSTVEPERKPELQEE